MTTIAYCLKRKQVAVDSRITSGHDIATDSAKKWREKDGVLIFLSGDVAGADEVIHAMQAGKHRLRKSIDVVAYAWNGTQLFEITADGGELEWHPVVDDQGAIGSGAGYALAAMDAGATPRQAVLAAIKRDTNTGGKVNVIRLRKRS